MTRFERARQVWSLLVCAARDRKTCTYSEIRDKLGMRPPAHRGIGKNFLEPIMCYCAQNDLPPLTVLVVRKDTGQPGKGLTASEDPESDRERAFAWDWSAMEPPEAEDFEAAVKTPPRP